MKTCLTSSIITAILVGFGFGPMVAQQPADDPLGKFSWLVGGKWVAEIKTPKGEPLTVEMTCQWTGHKKALKYPLFSRPRRKLSRNTKECTGGIRRRKR